MNLSFDTDADADIPKRRPSFDTDADAVIPKRRKGKAKKEKAKAQGKRAGQKTKDLQSVPPSVEADSNLDLGKEGQQGKSNRKNKGKAKGAKKKKAKEKREKRRQEDVPSVASPDEVVTWINPASEDAEAAPAGGSTEQIQARAQPGTGPAYILDADTSPDTLDMSPSPRAADDEVDVGDDEKPEHQSRKELAKLKFLIFMLLLLAMLPLTTLVACGSIWVLYLDQNSLSFMACVVCSTLPIVSVLGLRSAWKRIESGLQMFAFLMLLVLSMQLAVFTIVMLDSGALVHAYLNSVANGFARVCENMQQQPVGAEYIPVEAVCECVNLNSGTVNTTLGAVLSSGSGSWIDEFPLNPILQCLVHEWDQQFADQDNLTSKLLLAAVASEVVVAFLAWGMMEDIDVKRAKKLQKKGALPTGMLRGTIVQGHELRNATNRKKNTLSLRWVVIELHAPGLRSKHHVLQSKETPGIEDDSSPEWQHEFEELIVYPETQFFHVNVYDKPGSKARLVGSAVVSMEDGFLPEYDHHMNGRHPINIPLLWNDDYGDEASSHAGSVDLLLTFVPEPSLLSQQTAAVTKTWYFEATVLFMVALSMLILAVQSPADPPNEATYFTIRIVEVFVATHMTMELTMELAVVSARGGFHIKAELWLVVSLLVLICNWLSILTASGYSSATLGVYQRVFSVGRVFRIIRPIRTLRLLKNVDQIVTVIQESASMFVSVCMLLIFLLAVFALIGMSSFGGALQFECITDLDSHGSPPKERTTICSSGQMSRAEELGITCPVACPHTLACTKDQPVELSCAPLVIPRERDFDTFSRSLVTMFVQTTNDGGMHAVPLALWDAGVTSLSTVFIFHFAASVLLHLVALNLFLAVCCGAYSDVIAQAARRRRQLDDKLAAVRAERVRTETNEERLLREAQEEEERLRARSHEEKVLDKDWVEEQATFGAQRMTMKSIVLNPWFERGTSLVILANTIAMFCVYKGMEERVKDTLHYVEVACLVCFVLEALCKAAGIGTSLYLDSASNKFDLIVVLASVLGFLAVYYGDVMEELFGIDLGSAQALRAVRLLRTLQIARLLQRMKALRVVLRTIFSSWKPLLVHSVFCFFSMAMFSIIGMHMFGGSLGPACKYGVDVDNCVTLDEYEEELPEHFETFYRGLLTTFELTVGEEWCHTMYWYQKHASSKVSEQGYPEFVIVSFFIIQYLWMNCILFSLYIAMLLENFRILEEDKLEVQKRGYDRKMRMKARRKRKAQQSLLMQAIQADKTKGQSRSDEGTLVDRLLTASNGVDINLRGNKSLLFFKLNSKWRLKAARLQQSQIFSQTIILLILLSCISLAVEGPGEGSESFVQRHLAWLFASINVFVLLAFAFEACLKSVIHGFILPSGPTRPYLSQTMNRIDFLIIVLCTLAYFPFWPMNGAWSRALRLGRVITPMLNLSKNPSLKLVFVSFARAVPDSVVVLLPLLVMSIVFAIVGVEWFAGTLDTCWLESTDDRPVEASEADLPDTMTWWTANNSGYEDWLFTNETTCNGYPGPELIWHAPAFNFDDSITGMASVFVAVTDGAHEFMLATTADQPGSMKLYWVFFHLIFTCFFLNLFFGVLSASFEKTSGLATKTIGEKNWDTMKRTNAAFLPTVTDSENLRPVTTSKCCGSTQPLIWYRIRLKAFELATDERLEILWRVVIIANTGILALDEFPAELMWSKTLKRVNLALLSLSTFEVLIKLVGYGVKHFFSSGWLVSDLIFVIITWALEVGGVQSGVQTLRVTRIFRMVVLASKFPNLVALIETLFKCLRESFALILITMLIVYFYGVLGMNMFGLLPKEDVLRAAGIPESQWVELRASGTIINTACPSCESLQDNTNFADFLSSFQLLMQVLFGQELEGFITDMQFLGISFWVSFGYFCSFYIITFCVCVNLLIVTVLSNFDSANAKGGQDSRTITPDDMQGFAHTWAGLTIGPHSVPALRKHEHSILQNLMEAGAKMSGLAGILGTDTPPPVTSSFEDGDFDKCGTLTVAIESIDGLLSDAVRPYCIVVARGRDSKSSTEEQTDTLTEIVDGAGSWISEHEDDVDHLHTSNGARMEFHINEFHSEIRIEVRDAYKFHHKLIGKIKAKSLDELRAGGSEPVTLDETFDLFTNETLVDRNHHRSNQDINKWVRFDILDGNVSPLRAAHKSTVTIDHVLHDAESTQAHKEEVRLRKSARKTAAKHAKKRKKKIAKERKRARKSKDAELLDDKATLEGIAKPAQKHFTDSTDKWVQSGVRLRVTLHYAPKLFISPARAYLADYQVRYSAKEANCGIEGWLEVSEDGAKFAPRFVYVQDSPVACLKFVRNCENIAELEDKGVRERIKIFPVPGSSFLTILGDHSNHYSDNSDYVKRKDCNFQLEADLLVEDSTKLVEPSIGHLVGTIVGATSLQDAKASSSSSQAVQMVKKVVFEEATQKLLQGQTRDETRLEEVAIDDDPDQILMEPTVRYMVASKRVTVRRGAALDSEEYPDEELKRGTVITVTHMVKLVDRGAESSIVRLRFDRGWVSVRNSKVEHAVHMVAENSKNEHYRLTRACIVGDSVKESHTYTRTGAVADVEELKKGIVVEVEDTQPDPETGMTRLKLARKSKFHKPKWISTTTTSISATSDPFCVVTIETKEQYKSGKQLQRVKTDTVDNNLNPQWDTPLAFDVFPSSVKLHIEVWDDCMIDQLMGTADVDLCTDGIPGRTLSGAALAEPPTLHSNTPIDVTVRLAAPQKKTKSDRDLSKLESGDGDGAEAASVGQVTLRLKYTEVVIRSDLVAKQQEAGGDLVEAMMAPERQRKTFRFRAISPALARGWLATLRWIANGCTHATTGEPCEQPIAKLPAVHLLPAELSRCRADVTLLDLPFHRATALLRGLYARKVMGKHKPTLRWLAYTLFNLETHSCTVGDIPARHRPRKMNHHGLFLQELRGLNFHLVLERLCLLHYGKSMCLSYPDQVKEYQAELWNVALHTIQAVVALWVCRKRTGKTISGRPWPFHLAWVRCPEAYKMAALGVATSRLRSLKHLRAEIDRRSKPALLGVELAPREREDADVKDSSKDSSSACCCCLPSAQRKEDGTEPDARAVQQELDPAPIIAAFNRFDADGTGSLDKSELRAAVRDIVGAEAATTTDHADEGAAAGSNPLMRKESTTFEDSVLALLDTDGDGEVQLDEFIAAVNHALAASSQEEELHPDDEDSDLEDLDITVDELQEKLLSDVSS